jgi:hypothetical protein
MQYVRNTAVYGETAVGPTATTYRTAYTGYSGLGAVINVINPAAASTMQYKVDIYFSNDPAANAYPIIAETTVAPSTYSIVTSVNVPFWKMVISVKHTAAATFQFDVLKY